VSAAYHVDVAEGGDERDLGPLQNLLHRVLVFVHHEADGLAVFVHDAQAPDFAESGQQAEQLVCVNAGYCEACLPGSRGRRA
jgi:hypothetical protein